MTYRHGVLLTLAMLVGAASPARAQEQGQIGITMGYPSSIGVMIHLTDRIAVRPDFRFSRLTSDDAISDTSSDSFSVGIAGLVYLTRSDALRTYAASRFGYSRTTSEFTTTTPVYTLPSSIVFPPGFQLPAPQTITTSTTTAGKSINGTFGAQYAVHRRFTVFGEVGVGYSWSTIVDRDFGLAQVTLPTLLDTSGPKTWSSQTAAGVILYFKD